MEYVFYNSYLDEIYLFIADEFELMFFTEKDFTLEEFEMAKSCFEPGSESAWKGLGFL